MPDNLDFNVNLNLEDFNTSFSSWQVKDLMAGDMARFKVHKHRIKLNRDNTQEKYINEILAASQSINLEITCNNMPLTIYSRRSTETSSRFILTVPYISPYSDSGTATMYYREEFKEEALAAFDYLLCNYLTKSNWKTLTEFFHSAGRIETKEHSVDGSRSPEILPQLYPNVDIDKLIEAYYSSNDSILILYGDPGTGKTSFIKKLIYNFNKSDVAYIKDDTLVSKSALWSSLNNFKLIILDDLDCKLTENRQIANQNASSFMSNILSFSDGIINPFEKPKIVISTNQNITEIDSALVRPGRCFDFIHLTQLTKEHALDIWVNLFKLSIEAFETSFNGLDFISQSSLVNERDRLISGSSTRDYIKSGDKTYSIEKKLANLGISISESTDKRQKKSTGFN